MSFDHPDWKAAAAESRLENIAELHRLNGPMVTCFRDFEEACRMVDERARLNQLETLFGRRRWRTSK